MGRISMGRVIMGGLLAGLVINLGEYILNEIILKEKWTAAMEAINLTTPDASAIMSLIMMGFVQGIIIVWMYAAMRPRFGAGAGTAVRAGIAAWFLGWFIAMMMPMTLGVIPGSIVWVAVSWGLVEVTLAAVAGAWLYKEA